MKLQELSNLTAPFGKTQKMPVLFLGHGSPMNAIEENEFVAGFRKVAKDIPTPQAILCISAHWETKGTFVTAMAHPPTIHDFGGFPKALFDVQYPAPGSPELARETQALITQTEVHLDDKWGLDHGAWSVIKHLYPAANIPVIQMSIDYSKPAQYHYELAREIKSLREKGVLIIGSGLSYHNLRMFNASGAVQNTTSANVLAVARRLGFRPNLMGRNLRATRTRTLGVMLPTLNHPVFAECLQGIESAAQAQGYAITLSTTGYRAEAEESASERLLQQRVDGLILTVADATRSPLLDKLDAEGVPYVLAFNQTGQAAKKRATKLRPSVGVDNRKAAQQMGRHHLRPKLKGDRPHAESRLQDHQTE